MRRGPRAQAVAVLVTSPVALADDTAPIWATGTHRSTPRRRSLVPDVSVRLAGPGDRPLVERLWLMFRHDLSEFDGLLPHADGTFRSDRLDTAFSEPDWAPYLLTRGDSPAGFAFVRGLRPDARAEQLLRGARRTADGDRDTGRPADRGPAPGPVGSRVPGRQRLRRALLAPRRHGDRRRRVDGGAQIDARSARGTSRCVDLVQQPCGGSGLSERGRLAQQRRRVRATAAAWSSRRVTRGRRGGCGGAACRPARTPPSPAAGSTDSSPEPRGPAHAGRARATPPPARPRPGPGRLPAARRSRARDGAAAPVVPVQPERLRGDPDYVGIAVQQDQPITLQPRLVAHVGAHRGRVVQTGETLPALGPAELPYRIGRLEPTVPALAQRQPAALPGLDKPQLKGRQDGIVVRQRGTSHGLPPPDETHRSRSSGRNLLAVKITWQTSKIPCQRSAVEVGGRGGETGAEQTGAGAGRSPAGGGLLDRRNPSGRGGRPVEEPGGDRIEDRPPAGREVEDGRSGGAAGGMETGAGRRASRDVAGCD